MCSPLPRRKSIKAVDSTPQGITLTTAKPILSVLPERLLRSTDKAVLRHRTLLLPQRLHELFRECYLFSSAPLSYMG